jgi:RimJ/RimL family protein N-acetyltransferase
MSRPLDELKAALLLDLGPGVHLRPLKEADVSQAYVDGLNDPQVHKYMSAPRLRRQTPDTVRAYVRDNAADANAVLFGIFADGALRGTVRLHDIDTARRGANIGIALFDRAAWGRGLGTAAIAAVARFAAATLGLERLSAGIADANAGSVRAFEKAGFRRAEDTGVDPEIGATGRWVLEARAAQAPAGDRRHG